MTPMIDVVFLLIIFFLVSSHLAKQENSLALDLPLAASGLDDTIEREAMVVNVLPSGTWQIAGVDVEPAAFPTTLRKRLSGSAQPIQLKIRVDKSVTYSHIEPILRMASEAGIGDIVFSVFEDRQQ